MAEDLIEGVKYKDSEHNGDIDLYILDLLLPQASLSRPAVRCFQKSEATLENMKGAPSEIGCSCVGSPV